jgi:hypothetical protein
MQHTEPQHTPSITLLNSTGDVTITWDAENEAAILGLIEEKLAAGVSFFIIEPRSLFGIPMPAKKVKATSMEDIALAGSVRIKDKDVTQLLKTSLGDAAVEKLVESGKAVVQSAAAKNYETTRRANSAEEVLRSNTIAVPRIVGG